MPRKPKFIPGPSRLSKILEELNKEPKPYLNGLKSLKLTYAYRNDHFGAKHFVKADLPRIRYLNPNLAIEVVKKLKTKEEDWNPELVLELRDGSKQTLDLDQKWSSTIFQELMDIGGGTNWQRWKRERIAAGLPIVDVPLPKKAAPKEKIWDSSNKKRAEPVEEELVFLNPGKTGAAAILP
ncbi:hypothetical protein EW026_g3282 [Hermanssonia centrifuga]|uniref:Ribosomal protein/NADH dehydrogenase domain-containing protein n=1 Tax=Hermanssonia centrifuga TaxID=98765 RepID=A0A4S4KLP6_9APHY|nr:hypothetical protein EW026_g3282 [Hermanssonia centrifuga]